MITTATAAVTPTPLEARTTRGGDVSELTAKKGRKAHASGEGEGHLCARMCEIE